MINLQQLIDDAKCYAVVREVRWPDGVRWVLCLYLMGLNLSNEQIAAELDRLSEWGYQHKKVNHSAGEYAWDEDGDGFLVG